MIIKSSSRAWRRQIPVVTIAATIFLAVAACSSANSTASGTSAGASASGTGSSEVSAAKGIVGQYTPVPTSIPVTTPLKSAPEHGKTVVALECNLSQCTPTATGVAEAAKAAGWNEKVIDWDSSNVATLLSAMDQALRYDPVAVIFAGAPPQALWQSEIAKYARAGAVLVPIQSGQVALSSSVPAAIDDGAVQGKIIANWFIGDSGADGNALVLNIPQLAVLNEVAGSISGTVKAGCRACSLQSLNLTVAQQEANQLVPAIVSALQRNRSVKYVLSVDSVFFAGLPAALAAAGITGVKLAGTFGDAQTEQYVIDGQVSAVTTSALTYMGWQAVDIALRHAEGMSIAPSDSGAPEQLLIKGNVGTPADAATAPADFRSEFERLWHV